MPVSFSLAILLCTKGYDKYNNKTFTGLEDRRTKTHVQLKEMNMTEEQVKSSDKKYAAVCGLFCQACYAFIGTAEDPTRLKNLAIQWQCSEEEVKCYGCRSEKRFPFCSTCKMSACAAEKNVDFCGECENYPCEDLRNFRDELPHRIEIFDAQERIEDVGYEKWLQEMREHYSCPKCHTINSALDLICRNCGNDPSCTYVSRNKQAIMEYFRTLREEGA
jgi:hypothetical protein